jgi:hypothetical protein
VLLYNASTVSVELYKALKCQKKLNSFTLIFQSLWVMLSMQKWCFLKKKFFEKTLFFFCSGILVKNAVFHLRAELQLGRSKLSFFFLNAFLIKRGTWKILKLGVGLCSDRTLKYFFL